MIEEDWNIPSEIEDCEPTANELDNIYQLLDQGGMIELKWKCPGKRAPSPMKKDEIKMMDTPEQEAKLVKEMEFDFRDDVTTPQNIRQRQTPKASAKKKTNFDIVINQMRKHGRLLVTAGTVNAPNTGSGSANVGGQAQTGT